MLATSHAEPGPERQPQSKTLRRLETAAATTAAWIGILFSKTPTVLPGPGIRFEENRLIERRPEHEKRQKHDEPITPDQPLVPWVKLDRGAAASP